jgi:hypothetical protein
MSPRKINGPLIDWIITVALVVFALSCGTAIVTDYRHGSDTAMVSGLTLVMLLIAKSFTPKWPVA